ncbi:MAG: hypothetical protein JNK78_14830, partial [Planctomycetes bacterium]|nr:hypothetical protein [Planctomycetota bacterium]
DPDLGVVLVHELGSGDTMRVATLANPAKEAVAIALDRLRDERHRADRERATLAATVGALLASGRVHDARSRQQQLALIDARLGNLDVAIDEAIRVMAGDTPRATKRRVRAAAVSLGERRLQTVQQVLVARLGPDAVKRIEWRRPRAVEAEGTPAGGRVVAATRRRAGP